MERYGAGSEQARGDYAVESLGFGIRSAAANLGGGEDRG